MSKYFIEFELQGLPKTTNSLAASKWQLRHAHAKRWKREVAIAVGQNRPESPLKSAKLVLTRCSARPCDFDGLVSSFKHIIDGLTEAGIIENDDLTRIGIPTYIHEKAGRNKGKIRVRVEAP